MNPADKQCLADCAVALNAIGHKQEAAHLWETAGDIDNACHAYVDLKEWSKVARLLPHVSSSRLHRSYAQQKENEGDHTEAIKSYQIIGDLDDCVRLYLAPPLLDAYSATEIVLQTKSSRSAQLIANFYQEIGEYELALKFLIMAGSIRQAFELAKRYNMIRQYGELLEATDASTDPGDFLVIAQYFEAEKYTLLAGKYFMAAKEYDKAMRHLLKASVFGNEENVAISLAIDCVTASKSDRLSSELIEFLLGEVDGLPKDPKFLFRLYMAQKRFADAARTAVIIGNQEQLSGNYRIAHDMLFQMYQV